MRGPGTIVRTTIAAGIAAVALAVHAPADAEVPARAVSSTGAVQHSNSRNGQAILSAAHLRPGDAASGTVTIANSGNGSAALGLEATSLTEAPGPGGGKLGTALRLSVRDAATSQVVYEGPLAGLSRQALGTWRADETRTYRFDVSLPSAIAAANSLQSSSARVAFRWTTDAADTPDTGDSGDSSPPPATGDPAPPAGSGGTTGGGTTGGGAPVTPPPAGDTRPPKLVLKAARSQKIRRGAVKVTATCDEDCRIVGASLKGAKWKAPAVLKARKKVAVTIKLSRKDAKKFGKRKKAVIKLKLTAADMAGNRAVAKAKIGVKR